MSVEVPLKKVSPENSVKEFSEAVLVLTTPCVRCGRPLTNKKSVERGMGNYCFTKSNPV